MCSPSVSRPDGSCCFSCALDQLGTDSFDIGEMAFDTAFDFDEQEVREIIGSCGRWRRKLGEVVGFTVLLSSGDLRGGRNEDTVDERSTEIQVFVLGVWHAGRGCRSLA